MDNQFLSTPLLTSGKKKEKRKNKIQKDELIKGLELKNNKLRTEIMKIQNVIDENLQTEIQEKPKERQSIMRSDENNATMTKELTNCYKRIKMYEYEIAKIQESQQSMNVVQKSKQIEAMIKEKKMMTDRLKVKLHAEQKITSQNNKKLNNGNLQQQIQKRVKHLTDQIKFLQEKEKDIQAREELKQNNFRKQIQFIKRLQNEMEENGVSKGELEQIKSRVVRMIKPNVTESNVSKISKIEKNQSEEIIEERTIDNFRQMTNDIKLLEKMENDYYKKIELAELQKQKATELNSETRDRLLEVQDDIQKVQREILIQKGKVLPSNLKPLKPIRSVSSQLGTNDKKKIPAKNISLHKAKNLTHILRHDEVGMTTEKGQRFTDRNILGKIKLFTPITGLTLYFHTQTGAIGGVQATYNHTKRGGEYLKKDRQAKQKQYEAESLECKEGQFFKSITGTLTVQDRLESLYVITNKGQSKRFGEPKTTNKSFSFDIGAEEAPVCIFGSLLLFKQVGKAQHSVIEHFGIQINGENPKNLDNVESNEFI